MVLGPLGNGRTAIVAVLLTGGMCADVVDESLV